MRAPGTGEAGFTLVEVIVAAVIAAVIGLAILGLVRMTHNAANVVSEETTTTRSLRTASARVAEDLSQTASSHLTIVTLPDQNHQVTLQRPVSVVAGTITWGVYDRFLGPDLTSRAKPNWYLRYTVTTTPAGERSLVRQILDDGGEIRREEVLARGIEEGTGQEPGFRLIQNGEMWRATMSVARSGSSIGSTTFDVALKN